MNENKIPYRDLKWNMLTFFHHSEVLRTPHTIYQCYHPGTFMASGMQNLRVKIFNFSCVLKCGGNLKGGFLKFFLIIE